jgi:spermidine synthase
MPQISVKGKDVKVISKLAHTVAQMIEYRPRTPEMVFKSESDEMLTISQEIVAAGTKTTLVSLRNSLFTGLPPCGYFPDEDLIIRKLSSDRDGTWMTDSPQELLQMIDSINRCRGHVLVGGLGLGVVAHLLIRCNSLVNYVTVIEQNGALINVLTPYLAERIHVIHGDFYHFVDVQPLKNFDYVYADTWQGTGEFTWWNTIVPLRRKLVQKGIRSSNIDCWAETEMTSQVSQALCSYVLFSAEALASSPVFKHYAVFRMGMDAIKYMPTKRKMSSELLDAEQVLANMENKTLRQHIRVYLQAVGTEMWESMYGKYWDLLTEKFKREKSNEEK